MTPRSPISAGPASREGDSADSRSQPVLASNGQTEAETSAANETAWLIEETWSGYVHYVHRDFRCDKLAAEWRQNDWRRSYGAPARHTQHIVTKNIDDAMRFPTRDAAEVWLAFQPLWMRQADQYQIREHMWPAPAASQSASAPGAPSGTEPAGQEGDPTNLRGSCEDPRLTLRGYLVCGSHGNREWHWRPPHGLWRDGHGSEESAVNAALKHLASAATASPLGGPSLALETKESLPTLPVEREAVARVIERATAELNSTARFYADDRGRAFIDRRGGLIAELLSALQASEARIAEVEAALRAEGHAYEDSLEREDGWIARADAAEARIAEVEAERNGALEASEEAEASADTWLAEHKMSEARLSKVVEALKACEPFIRRASEAGEAADDAYRLLFQALSELEGK